jgi:hypothetical protein
LLGCVGFVGALLGRADVFILLVEHFSQVNETGLNAGLESDITTSLIKYC